jgi:hypothetical protein
MKAASTVPARTITAGIGMKLSLIFELNIASPISEDCAEMSAQAKGAVDLR